MVLSQLQRRVTSCVCMCSDQADPRVLLACINPREAALVDCAAGVHVRLRLGGSSWPPQLMYRVSTYGRVTSMAVFEQGSAALPLLGARRTQQLAVCMWRTWHTLVNTGVRFKAQWQVAASSIGDMHVYSLSLGFAWNCCAEPDYNTWRTVCMDRPLHSMMQQWRAARVRTRTDQPDISYPQVVTTRQREARAKEARQQKMMRLYQRHHDGVAEGDEAAAQEQMLRWCIELRVDDYFQCALCLIPKLWMQHQSCADGVRLNAGHLVCLD